MPRIARATVIGYPHHVTQRGNYQQRVFENDLDFKKYKSWLKEYSNKYGLKIWAYCLMNNHVHFICVPLEEYSLSRTFNTVHMRYSQYVNNRKGVRGHLWQGRFFSCILDDIHLYSAIRYVENNPVRANIKTIPEAYRWSSARGHLKKEEDTLLDGDCYMWGEVKDWGAYLREPDKAELINNIRKNSMTGRPCGEDKFIETIEGMLGRSLKAKPWGRPRKKQ